MVSSKEIYKSIKHPASRYICQRHSYVHKKVWLKKAQCEKELENIALTEVAQTQEDKCHRSSFICRP